MLPLLKRLRTKDPKKRHASALDLRADLGALQPKPKG